MILEHLIKNNNLIVDAEKTMMWQKGKYQPGVKLYITNPTWPNDITEIEISKSDMKECLDII